MKTLFKAAITTGVLATGLAIAMPAEALSLYNFQYGFSNGSILSGVLEGEISSGSDNIVNISKVIQSSFDGIELGAKSVTTTGWIGSTYTTPGILSFDGTVMDFFARGDSALPSQFLAVVSPSYNFLSYTPDPENNDLGIYDMPFNSSNWSLKLRAASTTPTNTVPTPAAILPVLAGIFGAATKRKQKDA